MPAHRLSMRQIREVLRLCWERRLPQRAAARSLGLGQVTVSGLVEPGARLARFYQTRTIAGEPLINVTHMCIAPTPGESLAI